MTLVRRVFVDTGGWCALQVPDDKWHSTAAAVFASLEKGRVGLATSNLVIGETYTLLRMTHGHAAAWRFMDATARSAMLQRWKVDEKTERLAWAILRQYDDQRFSFVDATSFALMRQQGVRQALAFDSRFAAAGFVGLGVDGAGR